ncbi:sulfite exporter TauE/SafE family protein [Candidatus Dojkabacteria bacterium]|nr:sulfite exporter TauE/SafE family protein [Candidatus Dojkabacteria bacterium]
MKRIIDKFKELIKRTFLIPLTIVIFAFISITNVSAQVNEPTFVVYFTGIGCPHCAKVDSILLKDWLHEYPDLVVVEYEVYQESQNAIFIDEYNTNYNCGYHIPLVIFDKDKNIVGDKPILSSFREEYENHAGNKLPLSDGSSVSIGNISDLSGKPKVWTKDRVAIKTEQNQNGSNEIIKEFISGVDINGLFEQNSIQIIEEQDVQLSGSSVHFDNAAKVEGWILQWNGPSVKGESVEISNEQEENNSSGEIEQTKVLLGKTISLAAVDAVNPCALAVLTMMLIAIISYNPKNKKNIILAGLAFSFSVFIMYMVYGLVIIRFFKIVQAITNIRLILYKFFGIMAIILGVLQIKDFLSYKPGSLGTEMPMSLRPKIKKIIEGITSPNGAFGVGLFVTLFLLPCTIGPYIILGGMLSFEDTLKSIPHLIIYNLIFISPMLLITCIVYFGISKVEDISEWKDKKIRILHLVAGLIIACLGIAMLVGLL